MEPARTQRDSAKPGFNHCASVNISLREKQVRCNRELTRIQKNLAGIEKQHVKNMRKFDSAQRGLMLLIGKSPYPDCTREEAIFLHNQPGFCYRANGNPRYFRSLDESKSRKIVSDIEGKEGLRPNPALNVVSDTPTLAEILSSPEIVQILCELRNTGALMANEALFQAFSDQLSKSQRKFPFFKEFQGPMDYLKQYRKNLIQEFFDTLKTEAEMKLFVVPVDPTSNLMKELPLLQQQLQLQDGSNRSSAEKSESAGKDNEAPLVVAASVSKTSTSNRENDSVLSYNPNLAGRIVKNKNDKKLVAFGGVPAPPLLPHQINRDAASSKGDVESVRSEQTKSADKRSVLTSEKDDESDIQTSVQMSRQEIFAPTDYIPTGLGYMTVEDWNHAVLDQLRKAQEDEKRKDETKARAHKEPIAGADAVANRHHYDYHHQEFKVEMEGKSVVGSITEDGDEDEDRENENDEELNEEEKEALELRKKMAAAAAAEEEARYRLDQKIMGLAGITSLYKSNNIGFAKYFENKDELLEKEISRKNKKRKSSKSKSKVRRRSFRKVGETEKDWFEQINFDDETSESTMLSNNNNEKRKGKHEVKDTNSQDTLESSSNSSGFSASVASSRRRILKSKNKMKKSLNSRRTKNFQREEFDGFVRGLIHNIEAMSAISVQLSGLAKKRPVHLERLVDPLLRLLKREDLFDTLDDEDIFFSEFEGGKKELERIVASHLPNNNKPKPGGFTFKLPSKTSLRTTNEAPSSGDKNSEKSANMSDEFCYPGHYIRTVSTPPSPPFSANTNKPGSALSSGPSVGNNFLNSKWDNMKKAKSMVQSDTCWICPPKSLQRVCCAACRAKTQQACNDVMRRDKNCKVTMSMNSWRIPGMNPPPYKKLTVEQSSHMMLNPYQVISKGNKIPEKLRKFYDSSYPIGMDERTRSVFLEPPTDALDMPPAQKQAAPTPVYLKKKLYPLPAVLNTVPTAIAAAANGKSTTNTGTAPSKQLKSGSVLYKTKGQEDRQSVYSVLPTQSLVSSVTTTTQGKGKGTILGRDSDSVGILRLASNLTTLSGENKTGNLLLGSKRASKIEGPRPLFNDESLILKKGLAGTQFNDANESWTLKVSKFDIMRLRHELDGESVKERMAKFEADYLRPNSS